MLITVNTFNGHNINDGTNYVATLLNPHGGPSAKPIYIEQAKADSQDSGMYTVDVQSKVLSIKIVNYASRHSLIAQLKSWFNRGTEGTLVVTFGDDGIAYQMTCRVINLIQEPEIPQYFKAVLQTGMTKWRAVSETTETTWTVTGATETQAISVGGKDDTLLSAALTGTAIPTNAIYPYKNIYRLPNTPNIDHGTIPWCITVDTAALVATTANKCQINQVGGINSSVTTIPYDTVTGSLPSAGMGYVDSEQITWTSKTGTTSGNLTGVTRGVGGTSAASHADNAEIKVSKMLANCNDLRVVDMLTGRELKRWISSPNNASTKVWIVVRLSKGFSLTLGTTVPSSGTVTTLQFSVTDDNKRSIGEMPKTGIVYHGNEWFSYTNTDPVNCRLTVGQRKLFGTTEEGHTAGVSFLWIQNAIMIKYGNSSATSPSASDSSYDSTKPLFSLSSSTNTSWVWTSSDKFFDATYPERVPKWTFLQILTATKYSGIFFIKQLAASGDPAIALKVASWPSAVGWEANNAEMAAFLYVAAGYTTISMTGDKYRANANWLSVAGLRRSVDGITYFDVWNEATPGSVTTWTAWTQNSIAAAGKYLQFVFAGGYPGGAFAYAVMELLTCTVAIDSANVPSPAFIGESTNYPMSLILENLTTGDAVTIDYVTSLNKALVIDGEDHTVQYDGINVHSSMTLDEESRSDFLRLQAGASNTIQITGTADLGTLSVVMSYYKRRL